MKYYDIHTHRASGEAEVLEVINVIIKEPVEKNDAPYRSYGIHPWYIGNVEEQMEELRKAAFLPETVAIGEAGLDKLAETDFATQEDAFLRQIRLAEEVEKPLIIHCVKAWTELLRLKKEMKPIQPWIVHGFRGKPALAAQLIEQGIFLSLGSSFNPSSLQTAWPGYVLTETDEKTGSIRDVYQGFADTLSLPLETVARQLAENSRHIFCL
ncbi:TatD DNase family protein [Parabacteroides sp. PM5-20]|uniref:TatD family hydrolase n=1 Tax=Parabacteroides sp. PM5-20 TaxID=2940527 RepID=UPI002476BFAC|nr:TatD family hydrolase [Parabacteroides sp. PM5-20]MDH6534410.1 TatD DNase family protein [Parabacteroides sp. PM5-20]